MSFSAAIFFRDVTSAVPPGRMIPYCTTRMNIHIPLACMTNPCKYMYWLLHRFHHCAPYTQHLLTYLFNSLRLRQIFHAILSKRVKLILTQVLSDQGLRGVLMSDKNNNRLRAGLCDISLSFLLVFFIIYAMS